MKAPTFLFAIAAATPAFSDGLCAGRYETASAILNAAYADYGTLYSGGGHWPWRDNLGATLDVWRLLHGQADLNLRHADTLRRGMAEDPLRGEMSQHAVLMSYLPVLLADEARPLSDDDVYAIATAADLITTPGPEPGWWLGEGIVLSPNEAQTQALAQTVPLVDWLQVTLAGSAAPWAYGWHLAPFLGPQDRNTYMELADYARGQDGFEHDLAWQSAWAVVSPDDPGQAAARTEHLMLAVTECEASPAEYAAHAILRFEGLRMGLPPRTDDATLLPEALRRVAFENITLRTLAALPWREAQEPFPDHLQALMPEDLRPWLNAAQSYRAGRISALIDIHHDAPLHPYSWRLLNLLSVDDLVAFANAPGRLPQDRRRILTSVFVRLYGLERDAEAMAMRQTLAALYPEQEDEIRRISATPWPRDVKLAMVLLTLPEASMWMRPAPEGGPWTADHGLNLRHRTASGIDLPSEMRSGAFLQRDFETFLRLPSRWGSFNGMRGFTLATLNRVNARDVPRPLDPDVPHVLASGPEDRSTGFHDLIAWPEITELGPRTGAARRAGQTLVTWVDARTDTMFERLLAPKDEMGAAMEDVIHMARHNDIGAIDGRPIARRAYELLSYRLYDSPAAERILHWYACSQRCEH